MTVRHGELPLLAVLYDLGSVSPLDLALAAGDLCELLILCERSSHLERALPVLQQFGDVVDVTGLSDLELIELLRALSADGVITFSEYQLARAGRLANALGLPAVVKPLTGASSRNAFSSGETISPLLVTGKFALAPPLRERGAFMPATLSEAETKAVAALAASAVLALGIRYGASHTEVKLTPDGPRVIEVNGRVGGLSNTLASRSLDRRARDQGCPGRARRASDGHPAPACLRLLAAPAKWRRAKSWRSLASSPWPICPVSRGSSFSPSLATRSTGARARSATRGSRTAPRVTIVNWRRLLAAPRAIHGSRSTARLALGYRRERRMAIESLGPGKACVGATLSNAAVANAAIGAAWEIGFLDELVAKERVTIADFAQQRDLHLPTFAAIVRALWVAQVVTLDEAEAVAVPGLAFDEVSQARGLLYWLSRASGHLLNSLGVLARNDKRVGDFAYRDGGPVSIAGREINHAYFDPTFDLLVGQLTFSGVADLGCGSAERLVRLAQRDPRVRGVGVDISEGSLGVARDAITGAGLDDRLKVVLGDVCALEPRPEYAGIELITSFLMAHHFWPRESCVTTLRRARTAFPNAKYFLLGDTCRSTGSARSQPDLFTLGFETVHSVMGVYLPTEQEWLEVFAESGWRCVDQRPIETPQFSFIFVLSPE